MINDCYICYIVIFDDCYTYIYIYIYIYIYV